MISTTLGSIADTERLIVAIVIFIVAIVITILKFSLQIWQVQPQLKRGAFIFYLLLTLIIINHHCDRFHLLHNLTNNKYIIRSGMPGTGRWASAWLIIIIVIIIIKIHFIKIHDQFISGPVRADEPRCGAKSSLLTTTTDHHNHHHHTTQPCWGRLKKEKIYVQKCRWRCMKEPKNW